MTLKGKRNQKRARETGRPQTGRESILGEIWVGGSDPPDEP